MKKAFFYTVLFVFLSLFLGINGYPGAIFKKGVIGMESRRFRRRSPFPILTEKFAHKPGDYRRFVRFQGRLRFYDLHVPPGYTDKPTPLVLLFHGGGGDPIQQRNDSQMDPVADREGFIIAYPAGTGKLRFRFLTFNAGICCGYAVKNNIDDVGFTKFIIEDLSKFFNIDRKRVYAAGFSNGAFMVYRLAVELSDEIAAIAAVSGGLRIDPYKYQPKRPISVIHFHGLKDEYVRFEGGLGKIAQQDKAKGKYVHPGKRWGVRETLEWFMKWNGIPDKPVEKKRVGKAVCERYGPGKEGSEVVLWILEDGGHTWPGGRSSLPESLVGKINRDISASELIWEFFKKHSLP